MDELLFLEPVFQEKIWGGNKLAQIYNYPIPSNHTGECWAISAHPNGMGHIANGTYQGKSLKAVFEAAPELFANPKVKDFPLLTKIIDANDKLSVQVHPDNEYAKIHEGELGKTECWYIIDAEPGAKIVYGHHAKTKAEFIEAIAKGKWDQLLTYVLVKKGDFFFVPSGTLHAIGEGILILETQQSSDTTYRVYDYDRKDDTGHLRELHIQASIDVTTVPAPIIDNHFIEHKVDNSTILDYIQSDYFAVAKWIIHGDCHLNQTNTYTLVSILSGNGKIQVGDNEYALEKGQHFIIPATITNWKISGKLEAIAATPGKLNS